MVGRDGYFALGFVLFFHGGFCLFVFACLRAYSLKLKDLLTFRNLPFTD